MEDIERLQALALRLLLFTRIADGSSTPGHPVILKEIVSEAKKTFPDLRILTEGAMDSLVVRGEKSLLISALSNVLENIAQYAPDAPASLQVLSHANSRVNLIIADHGPGVPSAQRERIFDPLTRLDSARSIGESGHGFGLGLAIARSILRTFGGDVICKGRSDGKQGAEFVMSLAIFVGVQVSLKLTPEKKGWVEPGRQEAIIP